MIPKDEWPTLALILLCYSLFATASYFGASIGLWVMIPLMSIAIALHSSLQHEVLHGHPTRWGSLNAVLVFPALGLFIPYLRFKDLHLAHHFDPNLTDPYDDPETNFVDPDVWDAMPQWQRSLRVWNNTMLGRMVMGPALSLWDLYSRDASKLLHLEGRVWTSYILHVLGVAVCLYYVIGVFGNPVWSYLVAAYLGLSLLKIRTFLEHRAHDRAAARSVIIEDRGPLALLFLNNNYHSVHHAHPKVVWHKLPKIFEGKRETFLRRNDGYVYPSYRHVISQHLLRAKDPVAHPYWSGSNRQREP